MTVNLRRGRRRWLHRAVASLRPIFTVPQKKFPLRGQNINTSRSRIRGPVELDTVKEGSPLPTGDPRPGGSRQATTDGDRRDRVDSLTERCRSRRSRQCQIEVETLGTAAASEDARRNRRRH